MLYVDDLTLLAHAPDAMQNMLSMLVVYARSKHLTINTAKSEVVISTLSAVLKCPNYVSRRCIEVL